MNDCSVVKKIIEEELNEAGFVSKYYVIEEIKNRIHPTRIFNKVLTNPSNRSDSATNSGVENIRLGADKIFRDSIRSLKKYFIMDDSGIIKTNEKKSFIKSYKELYEYNGQERTLRDWADLTGINRNTLYRRIKNGLSLKEAISKTTLANKLLLIIPDVWISRCQLKDNFCEIVDEETAINQCERRDKVESKRKRVRIKDHEIKIKKGKASLFTVNLAILNKKQLIEKDGNNIRRSLTNRL
jgi:hypothetical protein